MLHSKLIPKSPKYLKKTTFRLCNLNDVRVFRLHDLFMSEITSYLFFEFSLLYLNLIPFLCSFPSYIKHLSIANAQISFIKFKKTNETTEKFVFQKQKQALTRKA